MDLQDCNLVQNAEGAGLVARECWASRNQNIDCPSIATSWDSSKTRARSLNT
jgi:hypothetical protein